MGAVRNPIFSMFLPAAVATCRPRPHGKGVRPRIRLGDAMRTDQLTTDQRWQIARFLFGRAKDADWMLDRPHLGIEGKEQAVVFAAIA